MPVIFHQRKLKFSYRKNRLSDGRICVAVEIEKKIYKGVSFKTKLAKCAAANHALRDTSK
jgi:hypothetical protein